MTSPMNILDTSAEPTCGERTKIQGSNNIQEKATVCVDASELGGADDATSHATFGSGAPVRSETSGSGKGCAGGAGSRSAVERIWHT